MREGVRVRFALTGRAGRRGGGSSGGTAAQAHQHLVSGRECPGSVASLVIASRDHALRIAIGLAGGPHGLLTVVRRCDFTPSPLGGCRTPPTANSPLHLCIIHDIAASNTSDIFLQC